MYLQNDMLIVIVIGTNGLNIYEYSFKDLVKQWRRNSNFIMALQNNLLGQTPS